MNAAAVWVRVLCGLFGAVVIIAVFDAAIRTFLLPRVANVRLTRWVARVVGAGFRAVASEKRDYATRDSVLSLFPSILLLMFQAIWLIFAFVGFMGLYVASGVSNVARAAELSGSALFTLGTTPGEGGAQITLSYVEAGAGLTLLALLISFIPTLYAAFQRREVSVSRLSVRAGVSPTPWGVIEIARSVQDWNRLDELWSEWESWFIETGETHTTLTILNFYRSPHRNLTWMNAATTALDSAALFNAAVDLPTSARAGLCIRSGWIALRGIADYFHVPYSTTPTRDLPISITREEFELVLDHLQASGVPLVADRDTAWGDFVGWRVNYDSMVEGLSKTFTCPRTEWSAVVNEPVIGISNVRGRQ